MDSNYEDMLSQALPTTTSATTPKNNKRGNIRAKMMKNGPESKTCCKECVIF